MSDKVKGGGIYRPNGSFFDEDYFERGEETGKSMYTNFRWMPEVSIPIAKDIVAELKIQKSESILDYGCAKGFLVKALRGLGYNAWGFDTSKYAIENSDPDVREYVSLSLNGRIHDYGVCKDVLEHVNPVGQLEDTLNCMAGSANSWLVVVPLGDGNGNYVISSYSDDPSHIIKEPMEWWINQFENNFRVEKADFSMRDIKKKWVEENPKGNLFALLNSR